MPQIGRYSQHPSGFWFRDDSSGPYFLNASSGVAVPINGFANKSSTPQEQGFAYGRSVDTQEWVYRYFYDPEATNSAGTGTLANPFNTPAQMMAALSAAASASRLYGTIGIKRGTVTKLNGTPWTVSITGSPIGSQLKFVPYGDSLDLPVFDGNVTVTSWVQIQASPAIWRLTRNPITGLAFTAETTIYQNGVRVWTRNGTSTAIGTGNTTTDPNTVAYATKLIDIIAQGPGTMFYDNGTGVGGVAGSLVFYPFNNENPNLGQVELASTDTCLQYTPTNQTFMGNVLVEGIHFRGARNCAVSLGAALATGNAFDNISFNKCVVGMTGVDTGVTSRSATNAAAGSGFAINGPRQAARSRGCSVSESFAYTVLNNTVESSNTDGLDIYKNIGVDIGGCGWFEAYTACINTTVRYCYAQADLYGFDRATSYKKSAGWITQFGTDASGAVVTDLTANANIQFHHNVAVDCLQGMVVSGGGNGGTNLIQYNTFLAKRELGGRLLGTATSAGALTLTAAATSAVDFSGNLYVFDAQNTVGGPVFMECQTAGIFPTGNYNAYCSQSGGFRTSANAVPANTYYSLDLTSWKAAMTGFDVNSIASSGFTGGTSSFLVSDAAHDNLGGVVNKRRMPVPGALVGTYTKDYSGVPHTAAYGANSYSN